MPAAGPIDPAEPGTARDTGGRPHLRTFLAHPLLTPLMVAFQRRDRLGRPAGHLDEIAAYHQHRRDAAAAPAVSDRVWDDLDMDAVFAAADHCGSAVGQQVLYDLMRRPAAEAATIADRDTLIRAIGGDPELRSRIGAAVAGLRHGSAYALHNLFTAELPSRPRFYMLLPALTLAAFVSIGLAFSHPMAWLALAAIAFVNMSIQVFYRPRVHHLVAPIGEMRRLLGACDRLSRIDDPVVRPRVERMARSAARLRWIRRSSAHLALEAASRSGGAASELIESVVGYMNLLFLLDVNAFVFSLEQIRSHEDDLRSVFENVGFLDAMSSVAQWRRVLPVWSAPEIGERAPELAAEGVYHPLVRDAVPNDLRLSGRGLLVTGSNMAGKTTFLRAIGLAALLGQTLATSPARRWRAPRLDLATLISRRDNVLGGKSYFLVEAEVVKELLARSGGPAQQLFLIDEIFRGTNTRERVAASAAVLEHLARGDDLCLVSTHDLELLELLRDRWEFQHFRESVEDGAVRFDYLIRSGTSSAPNALRILEAIGFPEPVVREAFRGYGRGGQSRE